MLSLKVTTSWLGSKERNTLLALRLYCRSNNSYLYNFIVCSTGKSRSTRERRPQGTANSFFCKLNYFVNNTASLFYPNVIVSLCSQKIVSDPLASVREKVAAPVHFSAKGLARLPTLQLSKQICQQINRSTAPDLQG